jgi:hypothetical protein
MNDDMKLYIQKMITAKVSIQVEQLRADLVSELTNIIDSKMNSKVQYNRIP